MAQNQAQALQMTQLTLLPAILLSGYIAPRETLPVPLYLLSNIFPVTHFIQISRGIVVRGTGGHAAFPHRATDSILAGAYLVTALQSIVSRSTDPLENAVVSVTMFHGGEVGNVIPDRAKLSGSARTFKREVQTRVIDEMKRIATRAAEAFNTTAEVDYRRGYPPTVNTGRRWAVRASPCNRCQMVSASA